MSTYSLIQNGESGLSVRTTINSLLTDINNGVYIGPTGPDGAQGIQGIQGIQGLEGPQGLQGVAGLNGLQGIQGIQGLEGPQGSQGPQGQNGTFLGKLYAGQVASDSFIAADPSGEYEKFVNITGFTNQFYSVSVIGGDVRNWSVSNIDPSGFLVKSNSNTPLTNNVNWIATEHSNLLFYYLYVNSVLRFYDTKDVNFTGYDVYRNSNINNLPGSVVYIDKDVIIKSQTSDSVSFTFKVYDRVTLKDYGLNIFTTDVGLTNIERLGNYLFISIRKTGTPPFAPIARVDIVNKTVSYTPSELNEYYIARRMAICSKYALVGYTTSGSTGGYKFRRVDTNSVTYISSPTTISMFSSSEIFPLLYGERNSDEIYITTYQGGSSLNIRRYDRDFTLLTSSNISVNLGGTFISLDSFCVIKNGGSNDGIYLLYTFRVGNFPGVFYRRLVKYNFSSTKLYEVDVTETSRLYTDGVYLYIKGSRYNPVDGSLIDTIPSVTNIMFGNFQ